MFRRYPAGFSTDSDRIEYISLHLTDGALSWFTALSDIHDPRIIGTLEGFFDTFQRQYGGIDPRHQANLAIDNLRQGTESASAYISHFLHLSARSTYSNDALVNALRRGLNQALAERVTYCPHTYDLHVLQQQILQAELILQQVSRIHKQRAQPSMTRSAGYSENKHPGSGGIRVQRVPEPEAMEVDAIQPERSREKERLRRRTLGLLLLWFC